MPTRAPAHTHMHSHMHCNSTHTHMCTYMYANTCTSMHTQEPSHSHKETHSDVNTPTHTIILCSDWGQLNTVISKGHALCFQFSTGNYCSLLCHAVAAKQVRYWLETHKEQSLLGAWWCGEPGRTEQPNPGKMKIWQEGGQSPKSSMNTPPPVFTVAFLLESPPFSSLVETDCHLLLLVCVWRQIKSVQSLQF